VPFDLQVQHFVEVVRGGAEPNCTGEEALSAMVVCQAVKRAMETGEGVNIEGVNIEGVEIKERNKLSQKL
jgi:predicted dehydrogenase